MESFEQYVALGDDFNLEPVDYHILTLVALVYVPLNSGELARLCQKVRLGDDKGAPLTFGDFLSSLNRLQAAEFVFTYEEDGAVGCPSELISEILRVARAQEWFPALLNDVGEFVEELHEQQLSDHPLTAWHFGVHGLRMAFYREEYGQMQEQMSRLREQYPEECAIWPPHVELFKDPLDLKWLERLPLSSRLEALEEIISYKLERFVSLGEFAEVAKGLCDLPVEHSTDRLRLLLFDYYLFKGELQNAESLVQSSSSIDVGLIARRAVLALLRGDEEAALSIFDSVWRQVIENNDYGLYFRDYCSVLHLAALLDASEASAIGGAQSLAFALMARGNRDGDVDNEVWVALVLLCERLVDDQDVDPGLQEFTRDALELVLLEFDADDTNFQTLLALCLMARDRRNSVKFQMNFEEVLEDINEIAGDDGYRWVAEETDELLVFLRQSRGGKEKKAKSQRKKGLGLRSLRSVLHGNSWRRRLKLVSRIANKQQNATIADERVAWIVEPGDFARWRIWPVLQKKGKKGWTKGAKIALGGYRIDERLSGSENPKDALIAQELDHMEPVRRYGWNSFEGYEPEMYPVFEQMIGHPQVFWSKDVKRENPISIVADLPRLSIREQMDDDVGVESLKLNVAPPISNSEGGGVVVSDGSERFRVVRFSRAQREVALAVGYKGLAVPLSHASELTDMLERLSTLFDVHTHSETPHGTPMRSAESLLRVRISPLKDGLIVEVVVTPLGNGASPEVPGEGAANIWTMDKTMPGENSSVCVVRDLANEKELLLRFLANCPAVEDNLLAENYAALDRPEDCLEAIAQIQELGDDVALEWPRGETFKTPRFVPFDSLSIELQSGKDWFSVEGILQVDGARVIELRQLLEKVATSKSRFVEMEDGFLLALSWKLKNRLHKLSLMTKQTRGQLRIDGHGILALKGLVEELPGTVADNGWLRRVGAIEKALNEEFVVNSDMAAVLRPYQVEGCRWLHRLRAAGFGACLADDMGLGKTLQALVVLHECATDGPVLVVAPTSVCANWVEEVRRFTPTLEPILLAEVDREAVIDGLKPTQLLICSYALLVNEIDKLEKVRFSAVVLDEAQCIKNHQTKRAKAASRLDASWRLALSGTPVENHLQELWSIFNFINPGLLGTHASFHKRFAVPVERDGWLEPLEHLKHLVGPFVLRRLKDQVLDELPPKVELYRHIESSADERAFYEAQRQNAVERIDSTEEISPVAVLAELTRLRRACCNPALIAPELSLPSAKMAEAERIIDELIDSGHRALVFSQFVDHLALVRAMLDSKGITYQYLDGSTPSKERKKRIDAFQQGSDPLFLISLKAGGLGLNLTEANYVLHLDPWWNPASEDQASDRAHRMGQSKPVTVYRLIVNGTIEEKIVALHDKKRQLADRLLEGSEVARRLDPDALVALIKGDT